MPEAKQSLMDGRRVGIWHQNPGVGSSDREHRACRLLIACRSLIPTADRSITIH